MDSNNKKRIVAAIGVFTLIFAALAVFSIFNLSSNIKDKEDEEDLVKADYILALENALNITMSGKDDFADFKEVGYDMVIVPKTMKYNIKPCFDFVIEKDGVVITNKLNKSYTSYQFSKGMKIVSINDEVLLGKTYFEILELIYAKSINETKKFTFEDGTIVEYNYKNDISSYEYNKESNVLYLYNLDNITITGVYELLTQYSTAQLDLSMASCKKLETIVDFLSLFSDSDEELLSIPTNIVGQKNRKISSLNITTNEKQDESVSFILSAIKSLNENINIENNLNTKNFYCEQIIDIEGYTIYLKNQQIVNKA